MNEETKKQNLRRYKLLATGLFLLMLCIFVLSAYYAKTLNLKLLFYVKAFSEAAMVGALADWFAVTALFHHPLGVKIPHTNLIEKSKEKIGDNLGNFVVSNFLSPEAIRPYVLRLKVSQFIGNWLEKKQNQDVTIDNTSEIVLDIVKKLDDKSVVNFIEKKSIEMSKNLKINKILGAGIEYLLEKNDHQKLITSIAEQLNAYIIQNENLVQQRVEKGSYAFIPKFIDKKIAAKFTEGMSDYFTEVEHDEDHPLRKEISQKLYNFSNELSTLPRWEEEFDNIKEDFLQKEKCKEYSQEIWETLKKTLLDELSAPSSPLKSYLRKNLRGLSQNLQKDKELQQKIDDWVRYTAYRQILKNTDKISGLISNTVGGWQGRQLSNKLELEVGKDLQYIRINGTLVGGLMGLAIYAVSQFI